MVAELQIDRSKLIEAVRLELHEIGISEQIAGRLHDLASEERRVAYDRRARLRAMLKHVGIETGYTDTDLENAAQRLVSAGDGG